MYGHSDHLLKKVAVGAAKKVVPHLIKELDKIFANHGSIARKAYGKEVIEERHRHRYEVNPDYIEQLQKAGLVFSGQSPDGKLMEIAELPEKVHPFFLGTQFHPELKAHPLKPHPLFTAFVKAAINRSKKK
jgi:CTP synthase